MTISGFATGGAPGAGTTYPSAGSYDFGGNINYSLSSYTYAWSTGATTQNVTGLPLGPVSVTVTDCNGCTASGSWFILTNYVYGCMDTLAINYNPDATVDNGLCDYELLNECPILFSKERELPKLALKPCHLGVLPWRDPSPRAQ